MTLHWRRILVLLVLAVGTFSAAITARRYFLAVFTLLVSATGFAAYSMGLSHLRRPHDRTNAR